MIMLNWLRVKKTKGIVMDMIGAVLGQRATFTQYEMQQHQQALNNFRAEHGCDPHPAMNMVALIRVYGGIWRKSPFPSVKPPPRNL